MLNGTSSKGFQSAISADRDLLSWIAAWLISIVDAELPIATGLVSSCSTVIGESVPRVLIDDSNGAKNWDVSAAYALDIKKYFSIFLNS